MAGIYKAYDIRGIVGKELDEEIAYKIGRAFVLVTGTKGKRILVGHDMRPTSVPYSEALIKGITDEGANVIDAGLVSTPLFYFATKDCDAGIMVTASHNPKEYNGFKFCKEKAIPMSFDTGIDRIEALVTGELPAPTAEKRGVVNQQEFLTAFLDENLAHLKTTKPFTLVVDAANGMGGYTYSALTPLLTKRGISIIPLYFELDGDFPNHEANPLKEETLEKLKATVKEKKADLGVAIDGDGDRCVFIDERGETVRADIFTALISKEILSERQGGLILYDLRSSKIVRETIEAAGGEARMCRVGHAYIKAQMRAEGAILAGELSGHFYPGEMNYTENTMYALFKLLNLLEKTGKELSALVDPLRKYAFSGEINNEVKDPDAKLTELEQRYSKGAQEVSHMDGIRIEHVSWWFNARKSNTEPVLRLIVEADTEAEMTEKRDELLTLIKG